MEQGVVRQYTRRRLHVERGFYLGTNSGRVARPAMLYILRGCSNFAVFEGYSNFAVSELLTWHGIESAPPPFVALLAMTVLTCTHWDAGPMSC